MKVDVIIPIYNAYEYLVLCVESIYKQTNTEEFNLILINDCSPDQRISEYLCTVKESYKNITVYENEVNLGFVGTVNKGMRNTTNDVVLLNSDTEVTPFWIQKIRKAAYSKKEVATVTPLTNSGTICSVPNFCEDNEIPRSFESYEAFGKMIDEIKTAKYPEAPTGVGFCMYIKRSIINEIGYFDEERFGKGYGEENDFCCRCREHGYINIIDDCTFIYHKGSMSFESAKNSYIETNLKVLSCLYPYYNHDVAVFCENNPLKEIHDCIKLKIGLNEKKNNILFVLHNDFEIGRNHPYGGTEMHVKDIVDHMRYKVNCFVLSTYRNYVMLDVYYDHNVTTLQFPLEKSIGTTDFYRTDYAKIITAIYKFFRIGLIHIHHFKGNTFDLVDIAKQMSIPVYYTIHDYFSVCPNINLLYDEQIYCKYINSESTCNLCVKKKFEYNSIIHSWRKHFYNNLSKMDKIITPSISAKNIFVSYYQSFGFDMSGLKIEVIEHGEFENDDIIKVNQNDLDHRLTIVIFGGIAKHKGSKMIYKLLSECDEYDWFVIGNIYDENINKLQKDNVHLRGSYDKKDIFRILNEIKPDLSLTLPIWPETFSYVLSESFAAGIPVLGTNLGALDYRIIEGKNGWHVSFPLDLNEIKKKLNHLDTHRELIREIKNRLKNNTLKFVSTMNKEYEKLYVNIMAVNAENAMIDENRIILSGFLNYPDPNQKEISESEYNDLLNIKSSYYMQNEEYMRLSSHVQEINSSSTWKMMLFINTHFSGLKKLISSCIRFFKKLFHR